MSFGVPGLTPPIPALENFSVTGDPGAVRLHAGGLQSTSNLLSGQGRQISSIGSALAPHWNGEAATSFQSLSSRIAGAFGSAASTIEDAAGRLLSYATQLENFQSQPPPPPSRASTGTSRSSPGRARQTMTRPS